MIEMIKRESLLGQWLGLTKKEDKILKRIKHQIIKTKSKNFKITEAQVKHDDRYLSISVIFDVGHVVVTNIVKAECRIDPISYIKTFNYCNEEGLSSTMSVQCIPEVGCESAKLEESVEKELLHIVKSIITKTKK